MKKIKIRIIPLILGVYIGVGLLMTVDAWVSVALIDKSDPSTWLAMHPWVRIYFIPIFGTILACIASAVELTRRNIKEKNISSFASWIVLGLSYTTFFSGLIFSRLLPAWSAIILMMLAFALFNPIIVHYIFVRERRGNKGT